MVAGAGDQATLATVGFGVMVTVEGEGVRVTADPFIVAVNVTVPIRVPVNGAV